MGCCRSSSCVVPTLVHWLFTLVSVRFGFMVDAFNDLTRVRHIKIPKKDLQKLIITHAVDGLTNKLCLHAHVSCTARSTIDRVLQSCLKIMFNKNR